MDMTGEKRVPAKKDVVWEALNDPDVLKASIPGCEEVEKVSDNEFRAKVRLSIGPVKARFNGKVTLSDIDPPNGYTLTGEGSGGAAGFGKGEAKVSLSEDGDETIVSYTAHASVGGKLAQIGQRLIDSTAKKLTDQFFNNFASHLTEEEEEEEEASETTPKAEPAAEKAPAAAPAAPAASASCRNQMLFWALAVAGVVALWLINH